MYLKVKTILTLILMANADNYIILSFFFYTDSDNYRNKIILVVVILKMSILTENIFITNMFMIFFKVYKFIYAKKIFNIYLC